MQRRDILDAGALVIVAAALLAGPVAARGRAVAIAVRNESQFATAVAATSISGGTIVLLPHVYGELVVPPRSSRPLRIVGRAGVRVERVVFDHTQHVSLGHLTLSPRTQDASIEVSASAHVELHDLVVTAQGTRHLATVTLPDSRDVTIRRVTFTHCGDRSLAWSNCLVPDRSHHVTVEDSWFHDCYGCDFVHGRFGSGLTLRGNRFERALPCRIGRNRCGHQDLIELFGGQGLRVEDNRFGVYERGGAQLYLTNATDHVRIVNNVFVGTDPRVPGYRARIGLIVGSSYSRRLPHDVEVVNNTILTGATRTDGYAGSIRISSLYGGLPRRERPIFANNVIGLLEHRWPVCKAAKASIRNLVIQGEACSSSDLVGDALLDSQGRPTAASTLLIDRANRRFAPATDITGRRRGAAPDIGAYEFVTMHA